MVGPSRESEVDFVLLSLTTGSSGSLVVRVQAGRQHDSVELIIACKHVFQTTGDKHVLILLLANSFDLICLQVLYMETVSEV